MMETLLVYDGILRSETDAEIVATLRRKGWQDAPPQPEGGVWVDGAWIVHPVSMAAVRAERNQRLAASDWTQVADAPVDRQAWAAYRQSLRDLPSVYSGEGPIPWPQEPA
jgi:hypothetical protein